MNNGDILSLFFYCPADRGLFYLPKGITNENTTIFKGNDVVACVYG